MDVFKLAFETVIIGLFALPWLWVMIDLMSPDLFRSSPKRTIARVMAFVPHDLWPPVMSLVMFCLAYLLGSAISPIATEFLNDRGLVGRVLYTSEKIQIKEYVHMETKTDVNTVAALAKPDATQLQDVRASQIISRNSGHPMPGTDKWESAKFKYQESVLLLHGSDGTQRLSRLHQRLTVLSGAIFSAFIFLLLCVFAACAKYRSNHLAKRG